MENKKSRILYLKYLLEKQTDEQNPLTLTEITEHLKKAGFQCGKKAVKNDIKQLVESDVDVICNKGRELEYFIGNRHLELIELKMLADAIQASHFISANKSKKLISKLMEYTSVHQAKQLNRNLHIDKQSKTTNEQVFYTADILYTAIHEKKKVTFKYCEYDNRKKKVYKHNRQIYSFSPYAMLWNDDRHYVLGYSDNHGKIVKFRTDRIASPKLHDDRIIPAPKGFDTSFYTKNVFKMVDGKEHIITLKCKNSVMNAIIDCFGKDVETSVLDDKHFLAKVDVSVSPTFYSWIFGFSGKIIINAPQSVVDEYISLLNAAAKFHD